MESMPFSLNWWAILVAMITRMLIGWLWYGPLFGKQWMDLVGLNRETLDGQGKAMGLAVIVALVMSIMMGALVDYVGATTVLGGIFTGFFIWLGFVATTQWQLVLFESRAYPLFAINTLYEFTSILLMGIILGVWQ